MVRSRRRLGEGLVAFTEQLPQVDAHRIWPDDEVHAAEVAVATPFLRRMRALLALVDSGQHLGVPEARRTLRQAAPMTHLRHGPPELFETDLLFAAARQDLLRCDETDGDQPAVWSQTASVQRGAQAHLIIGQPLAAVVEPWIGEMLRDPVADLDCDPRLSGPWVSVPFLIAQLLVHAGEVDLTDVAEAVRREAGPLTRGVRLPWKLQDAVVGLTVGLCVEFGVAEWDGDLQDLGRARCTPLGLVAQAALRARVEGEVPPAMAQA